MDQTSDSQRHHYFTLIGEQWDFYYILEKIDNISSGSDCIKICYNDWYYTKLLPLHVCWRYGSVLLSQQLQHTLNSLFDSLFQGLNGPLICLII